MNDRFDGLPGTTGPRFSIAIDGVVTGDDGTGGQLAASLRYAARMASQVDSRTGAGDLVRVITISGVTVIARVDAGVDDELALTVHVEPTVLPQPGRSVPIRAGHGSGRVARGLHLTHQLLDVYWSAIITDDKRIVGRAVHDSERATPSTMEDLSAVGLRALAVLGAIGPRFRETAVLLDYERGSLLVVPLGEHALFAMADRFERNRVIELVEGLRRIITPRDITRAFAVIDPQR